MNLVMIVLMTLRIYSSIGNVMKIQDYIVVYQMSLMVSLVILLVQLPLIQQVNLQILPWTYLIMFILMLLKSV